MHAGPRVEVLQEQDDALGVVVLLVVHELELEGLPGGVLQHPVAVAVKVPGFGQKRRRLVRVEGARLDGGVVLAAARAEGADRGLRVAEHDLVDDAGTVREPGHCLAHPAVREARGLAAAALVPADVAVAGHRVHELEAPGLLGERGVVAQPPVLAGARGYRRRSPGCGRW